MASSYCFNIFNTELKKVLIIYPHFPPSNLAGVHRPRLFAQHLTEFGWEPVILTVHEKYYEEKNDWNLVKLLPPTLRIEKVKAFNVGKFRLVGDIGLRAFFQLYHKAKKLIKLEQFDFLYIPIPSFYTALLGRLLHASTGIKYGIDYIDPWVHEFAGSERIFSRHWWSTKLSSLLEPIAVKKVSLITGVAAGYYLPVFERNPQLLKQKVVHGAMPYGGEMKDHEALQHLNLSPYLFKKKEGVTQIIYAGAMLPKAYKPLEMIFKSIHENARDFKNVEFHFVGTGSSPNDSEGYNVKLYAEKYGLWNKVVFEYPSRIPYLDVLIHLEAADGIFILGSTEPHYTPSKTYQGVLSGKPLLAVLHAQSTAVEIVRNSGAGMVLGFNGEDKVEDIYLHFPEVFRQYQQLITKFKPSSVNMKIFENYSAKNVTAQLAVLLNQATGIYQVYHDNSKNISDSSRL